MKPSLYSFTINLIILLLICCGSSLLAQPVITSFSPVSGTVGTTVTISGSGFAVPHTNNVVYFGGARATSSAGTATSLTVTVPAGATSVAPITLVNLITSLQGSSLRVTGANAAYFTVTYSTPITITATSFVQQNIVISGTGEAVAIGDFNGDGRPDIAVGINDTSPADNIGILINNGSGFNLPVYYGNASSRSIYSIRAGDIDNDGDLDLVANTYNVGSNQVHVLQNDGMGVFTVLTSFSNTDTAREIYLADYNNDGRLDIITNGRGRAHLTLNTGGMSFGTPTQIGGSNASESIAIGDFDKDGNLDFLSCAYTPNQVIRFLGNGAGGFDVGTAYSTVTSAANATLGYFLGGDTYPDMVVSPYFGSALTLMQNNTGALGTPFTITATDPRGNITVDLNGDGLHDVLSVRYDASRNPLIFLNNGSGLNTPIVMTSASASGTGHARFDAADLNGDGFIDFVASTDGSAIKVNRYTPPPSFYTIGNASWNANGNWSSTDGGPDCACNPAGVANASVYIKSGHTVSVATAANIGINNIIHVAGAFTLNNGNANPIQTLITSAGSTINLVAGDFNLANPSTTTINGVINRQTIGTFPNGLTFANGSVYNHARNGGAIPIATWAANSNCQVTGVTNTSPTGFSGQTLGNLTWNSTSSTTNTSIFLSGSSNTLTIQGNFEIAGTGAGTGLSFYNAGTLGGGTINILGNFIHSGGIFDIAGNNASIVLNVDGDFSKIGTSGTLGLVRSQAVLGEVYLKGNFNRTTAGFFSMGTTVPATAKFVFVGTNNQSVDGLGLTFGTSVNSTLEIGVNKPSGTVTLNSPLNPDANLPNVLNLQSGTLDAGNSTITVGALQGTGTLILGNTATMNIAQQNSSFTGTLNAHPNSLINYNGTASQNIFAPSFGSYGRLTLTNANIKTLLGNIRILGNFTNNAGIANFDATTNNTTVTFNGATAQTVTGTSTFNNLIINQSTTSTVTLNNPITVANTLTLTNGIVILTNGNDLTVQSAGTGAIVGFSSLSYVRTKTGINNANLVRTNLSTSGTHYFPVGTDTEGYNLFAFSYGATSPAGNYSVKAISATTFSPLSISANTRVVWEVLKPIGTNANIFMDWQVPANVNGVLNDGDPLIRSDDNGATWVATGEVYNNPPSTATTFTTPAPFFAGSASPVRFAVVGYTPPLPTQPLGNRGLYFDGVDDYVSVNHNAIFEVSSVFAAEAWVKMESLPNGVSYPILSKHNGSIGYVWGLRGNGANSQMIFVLDGTTNFSGFFSASTFADKRWHHIAVSRFGGSFTYYIDGIDIGGGGIVGFSPTSHTGIVQIGSSFLAGYTPFKGQLDEIRVFDTFRSQTQIQADMSSATPNGAFAYWNFDESTGTITNNLGTAGGITNGTLTNSPLWALRITNTLDDGSAGSLRWAINEANADVDTDYIDFSIQQASLTTISTITLTSPLSDITQPIIIDGYSAFGSLPNINTFNAGNNAQIRIEINAVGIGSPTFPAPLHNALTINNTNNSLIRGLSIFSVLSAWGSQNAISIKGASTNNAIEGCYIGLLADGSIAPTNMNGVEIGGTNNTLGWSGTIDPKKSNVISNSAFQGVVVAGNNNLVQGNYIGTDITGTASVPNAQRGVVATSLGTGNQILNNLISGNGFEGGVYIQNSANNTVVRGNRIGTRVDGTGSIPNSGNGITVTGNVFSATDNTLIGGTGVGEANIIANNNGFGVGIENGSFGSAGNKISGNNIFGNVSGGIALIGGSNASKVAPSITAVTPTLASGTCEAGDIVEVFKDNPQTGTTNQGRVFLGTATTIGTTWTFLGTFAVGDRVTATATSATNNTSPFSNAFVVPFPAPTITSISPASGAVGTPITISGSGFNPSAPNDVYFGAVKLTANANATGTQITVNVPAGVGSIFPITVRNHANNLQASSLTSLTPLFNLLNSPPLSILERNYKHLPFISTGDGAEALSIGDMNNDGNPDIVVSNRNAFTVTILLGDGLGNFPLQNSISAGSGSTPFAGKNVIADFDSDGELDIAVINDDDELSILLNNGGGVFTPTYLSTGGSIAADLISGDFNQDGKIDLIITNYGFAPMTNNIRILLNNGSGTSFTSTTIDPGAGISPAELAVGDFDEDGDLDAVVITGANLRSLINDGTGSFVLGGIVYTGISNPRGMSIGDYNGDNHVDVAISEYNGEIRVLLGDGNFGFTAHTISTGAFQGQSIATADWDGDGIDDLILANGNENTVTILLGDNSGTAFSSISIDLSLFGADNVNGVAVADFDKNGKPDFVTSQYSAGGVIASLYELAPPIALAATNVTTAGFFANWTNTGVSTYDVEYANNLAFTGATLLTNIMDTFATINVPSSGAAYYYRVRNGGATNFSNIRTVFVPPAPGSYRAMQFDGANTYIQSNKPFNTTFGTDTFTIEAWIKYDGGVNRTIAHSNQLTTDYYDEKYWRFYVSSGDLHLDISDGFYPVTLATGSSPVVPNEWTHVAVSRNAVGDITFYVNGIDYPAGNDLLDFSNNGFLRIGATRGIIGSPTINPNEPPTDVFSGGIDELRIWKSARTLAEIRSFMCQKLVGNEANLLAYYRFDEPTGIRTENRAIGSDSEGVLHGGTLRINSGAALGDVSAFQYSTGSGFSFTDGETISVSYTGLTTTQGVQLYKVRETPNSISTLGFATLETSRYYGVFKIGNPSSVSFTLDYTNNPLLNTGTSIETRIRLGRRKNGADLSWRRRSLPPNTNPTTNTVVTNSLLESGEFIAGIANPLPFRPGSGTAVSFNGTNQYIDLGDDDALDLAGTPFTLEAWIKMPAAIAAQQHTILGKGIDNTDVAYRFDVDGTTRRAGILVGNGVTTAGITTLIPIPADEWTHVAVTYDGSYTLNIYQNGILQNIGTAPLISIPNGTDNARIGSLQLAPTNFFQGQIDELRIWNVVRSVVDIRNTMCQKLTGTETGLVSYYRFDEGVGAVSTNDWAGVSDGQFFNAPPVVLSGAALGDISANQYDIGTLTSVVDTDQFIASFATPLALGQGVHVYKVREAPNVTLLPTGTTLMEASRYFGVFKVNAPNVDISYKYDDNPNINGTPQEYNALFLERDNNADPTWSPPLVPTNFGFTLPDNKYMDPPTPAVTATHREFVVAFSSSVPNIQASNIQFTSVTSNSIGLRWTSGNGQNRIVVMSTNPSFTPPTNATNYTVGQNIGTGTVIYNGSGNIATANNLIPKTRYYFHVFEYNGTGASTIYNTAPATGNPNSISTLSIAPQSQPTGITFLNITTTTATVSFTPISPLAEGYLAVIRRPTDMPIPPADGMEYTVGTQFFNGQVVVFSGLNTSFNLKGLIPATVYVIDIYAFNGSGNNTAYNKINPLSGEFRTHSPLPQLTSISPNLKTVGDKGFIMQLNGNGFIKETQALWFGQVLSTTFVNATTLTAVVPDNRLFEAGVFPISVTSPSPGGGTSNALPFTVIPLVSIQSIPLVSRIVPPDKNNHLLYRLEFFSAGGESVLGSLKFTIAGSYQLADLKETGFTLWLSKDENLDETDRVLRTALRVSSGSSLIFDLSRMAEQVKFPRNDRGYILLSVNISAEAKQGNEIKINGVKFDDIEFANAVTKQGKDPAEEGIAQKITASTPTPQDYSALVKFFNDMGGKDWIEPWNLDNPVTTWKGVELDEDGNVIALSLPNNNLVGKLSDAVMTDSILISKSLRYINLSGNKIEGQIPINLKNLTNLEYLDLSNNMLSGKIGGEINSLTHLVTLWLAYNQFAEIDIDFAKLSNLKNLFLQHNNLQKLNTNIGEAPNLEVLNLQGNQLKTLPETIGKLSKLKYLDISNNNLTAVPQSITSLLSLETLLMHDNFIDVLPNGMTNLLNLTLFTTYNNSLEFGSLEPLRNWWTAGQRNVNTIYAPQGEIGQPQELIVQVGSPLTLKIETTGTANRYQWFKNNVPIAGANGATFSISSLTVQDVGIYTLQVNNSLVPALTLQSHNIVVIADCGQVQSGSKPTINVEGASVFCGLEPVNTRLTTPESDNISAYQWFFNGIQINNSNRNNILAQDAGRYRVQIFTRDGCSLLSDEMTISVLPEYSVSLVQNQLTLQAIVTAGRQISNYEWFLNDKIILEATQGTYSPVEIGTYKVRVTDVNGCRSVSNSVIVNVVSTEENIYEGEVSVYPNPSNAIFYLELGEEKASKIQLFNALGKYYNERITPLSPKKYQIDLDNQARGLYFVEIITNKGKIVRKIVKE